MPGESCSACYFNPDGFCHRYPPVENIQRGASGWPRYSQPPIEQPTKEWCGEYKPKQGGVM